MEFKEQSEEKSKREQHNLPIDAIINMPKVKDLVPAIQEQLLSGDYDPLKAQIFFRKIGKLSEEILKGESGKEIKDQIEENIRKYQEGKTSRIYNVEIREQARGYWDYSECNDILLEELVKIEKKVKELIKTREKELQLTVPSTKIDLDKGFGIIQAKVAVPYFPVLELQDNNDLIDINPPHKGARTIFAYFL